MKYNTKINNKNEIGFMLKSLAFASLRTAEIYADRHNVEPNEIQADLRAAKHHSANVLPELEYLRELINMEIDHYLRTLDVYSRAFDLQSNQKGVALQHVDLEITQDRMLEYSNQISGLQNAENVINNRIEELRRINLARGFANE